MADNPDEITKEYTDQEEYSDNFLNEQREQWDEAGGNYPMAKKPDSLFTLFKNVWRTYDSSKVANLDIKELGVLGLDVRHAQEIAYFGKLLGHQEIEDYFGKVAEITLATSMSKKGWFVELFVTSKKFAHKGLMGSNLPSVKKQKWRIFGRENQGSQGE